MGSQLQYHLKNLVKINNELLCAADTGLLSILFLLNLSPAFDTISHQLLLEHLANIGVHGTVHQWFKSYLTETQFVQIKSCTLESSAVTKAVPQGSVLGPLLFIIYLLWKILVFFHILLYSHLYSINWYQMRLYSIFLYLNIICMILRNFPVESLHVVWEQSEDWCWEFEGTSLTLEDKGMQARPTQRRLTLHNISIFVPILLLSVSASDDTVSLYKSI